MYNNQLLYMYYYMKHYYEPAPTSTRPSAPRSAGGCARRASGTARRWPQPAGRSASAIMNNNATYTNRNTFQ